MNHSPQQRQRILIIDDEPGTTTLFREVLQRTGRFTVFVVHDALSGVESARTYRPHLILLDYHLPDRKGTQIAEELSADATLREIPAVFVTGDVDAIASLGGRPSLLKPVRAGDLIDTCAAWALPVS